MPHQLETPIVTRIEAHDADGGVILYGPRYTNDIPISSEVKVMPNTKLEIILRKNDLATIRKNVEFDLSSQDEDILSIIAGDGWKEMDIGNISNARLLIVYALADNIPFDVRLTFDLARLAVSGFDDAENNGVYKEYGTVNGKKRYVIDGGGYIQWSTTNLRWELYTSANVLSAYTDDVVNVGDGVWSRVSDPSPAYDVKIVEFTQDPVLMQCRDFFMFGPQSDTFMATISKIEISTSSLTQVQIFAGTIGAS